MFQVKECELTKKIAALDKQVTINENEPLITGPKSWIFLINGKRGSGKTTMMFQLLRNKASPYYRHFENIYFVSPSAANDEKLKPLIEELEPEGKFYDECSEEILSEIMEKIQNENKNYLSEKEEFYSNPKNKKKDFKPQPFHLLILDDCIHEISGNGKKGSVYKRFITTNRHLKTSIIITTQKYNMLNTLTRSNADMLALYPSHSRQELESVEKDLAIEPELFNKLFSFATDEPNSFLFVNLNGPSPVFHKKFDKICFDKVDT
jgi:Poxvirus A32 protein